MGLGEYLAYGLAPGVFALVIFVSSLLIMIGGYLLATRGKAAKGPDSTFGLIQATIGALMAFMLATTFALTSERFDTRRILVRDEANSIGTTNLRAGYLPAQPRAMFRSTLREYAQARLDVYNTDGAQREEAMTRAQRLTERLWAIASAAGHAAPTNVQLGWLTQSLNETIDLGTSQNVAVSTHVPGSIFGVVILLMWAGAFTSGLAFGRAKKIDTGLAVTVLVLLSAVVFTIDDLDRVQKGWIRVDLSPLQDQVQSISAADVTTVGGKRPGQTP